MELGNDQEAEIENLPLSSHALEQFNSNGGKGSITEKEMQSGSHGLSRYMQHVLAWGHFQILYCCGDMLEI